MLPTVKAPYSQDRACGLDPRSIGELRSHVPPDRAKERKKKSWGAVGEVVGGQDSVKHGGLGGVIAASGSVPHRGQLRPQHLQSLCSMCWGGAQPCKVGPARRPVCQPQPHLGAQHPFPPTVLAGMRRTLSWSRIWATSSPACHSSGRGIRCAWARASSQQGRGGTAGQGSQDPDPLCPPPRCCCVPGRRCTWIPPAPTPRPPPTTSTTLKCGRRSTFPSSCPAGTCASGFLWVLVARGWRTVGACGPQKGPQASCA